VVAVPDDIGALISQQRYLPFGQVRTIGGSLITQTDLLFAGWRSLEAQANATIGLLGQPARMLDR